MSSDGEGFMEAYTSSAKPSYTEETLNLSMTAKQPPSYDGKVGWFRYEELVDDWVTITTVEAAKRGPLLKSRLTGDAYMYKAVLQNDLLQDPDEKSQLFQEHAEEVLFERCDQRVSVQTRQFLQPQKAEPRVPHFYLKIRNPSHEIEGSMDGLDANLYGTVSIIFTVRTGRKCKNNCSSIQDPSIRPQGGSRSKHFLHHRTW